VGDRAGGAAAVGDQCRRCRAGGALSGAEVWRCVPSVQDARAAVGLMRAHDVSCARGASSEQTIVPPSVARR